MFIYCQQMHLMSLELKMHSIKKEMGQSYMRWIIKKILMRVW